jgi:hypothetical protein
MREADRQDDEQAAVGPTISEPFEAEVSIGRKYLFFFEGVYG